MIIKELKDHNLWGDLRLTPVSAVMDRLIGSLTHLPFPFLLESDDRFSADAGRFSFTGADPFMTVKVSGKSVTVTDKDGQMQSEVHSDPIDAVRQLMKPFREDSHPVIPFCGGAVGYFGYETGEQIESLPVRKEDELSMPDIYLNLYDVVFIYDSLEEKLMIASTGFPEEDENREEYAIKRIAFFREILLRGGEERVEKKEARRYNSELVSNLKGSDYFEAVKRIKGYIVKGDIYQANLSQRFSGPFLGNSYSLYRRFKEINPTPFGAYLDYPELSIVSNSPERFLSLRERRLETRPIKGTVRREEDSLLDGQMIDQLKESEKDGAEHLMIVDLERNDLGRVCRYGTVRVDELKRIESYTNLHHMVSIVSGTVRDGVDAFDCLKAAFPGGSITGAPKVRAMEIIHEVEPNPRWVYTGSIGYIGFDGSMDMNIAIRTAIVKDEKVYFSVGGGIVADSDPEAEFEETLLKGEIFRKVLGETEKKDAE